MAVYSSAKNPVSPTPITLFPVHAIVLAANCARLPPLRKSVNAILNNTMHSNQVIAPVVPLCLPAPATFSQLVLYLYTKKADALFTTPFLPIPLPSSLKADRSSQQVLSFAATLAQTYTSQALLNYTKAVHGLWQNVCALGIFDDQLSECIDLIWQILLTAIAIGTGNPTAMIPAAETRASSS